MKLDEVIELFDKWRSVNRSVPDASLVEVTAEVDGVLRGRAHCEECDALMHMTGQPVAIKDAELNYIELDGRRVVFHFSER